MKIGLRIDVDTFRGTRDGVPNLCRILLHHSIQASFFFSVGPDNMGRHLRRLVRPSFLGKMLRSRAASLYGWDILLRGTVLPGPVIGKKLGETIRAASEAGHEIGLHAWDHHAWQRHLESMDRQAIHRSLQKGVELLTHLVGRAPTCSAAPGWKCNDLVLTEKERFSFHYNSDCRGTRIFRPVVGGKELVQPQIPVTLPTYDEVIGRSGVSDGNYNDNLLSLLKPGALNVLTVHAEVEGIVRSRMFDRFLEGARSEGASFVPLGTLLSETGRIARAAVVAGEVPGRDGWVACQARPEPRDGDARC